MLKPHSLATGMKKCLTVTLSKYPTPLHIRRGHNVSYFTYADANDAKRASAIAEALALQGWDINSGNVYSWPGEIVVNKDKTFTVVVI